jgi:hypothetical protein
MTFEQKRMKRHSTLKRVVGKHTGRAIGHALHARRKKFWTSSRRRDLNGLTTIVPKQVKTASIAPMP